GGRLCEQARRRSCRNRLTEARMPVAEKAPAGVDQCRPLLHGTAKYLVDKLYGPAGPPWGTPFAALEASALGLGGLVQKPFLDLALAPHPKPSTPAPLAPPP